MTLKTAQCKKMCLETTALGRIRHHHVVQAVGRMGDIVVELTDVIDTVENSLLASSPSAWERTDWEVLDDVAKHIGELRNHMAAILYYWTPEATANLLHFLKSS